MAAMLVSGITGTLGSAIGPKLKERCYFLVRGGRDRPNLSLDYGQVIKGDITRPLCDVSQEDLSLLKQEGIDKILHIAASVKFDENLSEEIFAINLTGTKNILDLAKYLGVREFHYISTAYASTSRNPYERSKAAAEELVKASGIKYNIYRPSVLVGDSRTGEISDFNGFYGVYLGFHILAERDRIKRGDDGEVSYPTYVVCSSTSTINLVPVNWVSDMILKLMRLGAKDEIYNITHPNPPNVRWVMDTGFKVLGISGIKYLESLKDRPFYSSPSFIQRQADATLTRYIPYVTEEAVFDLTSTERALGADFISPPEITADFLAMLLNYAAFKNFGRLRRRKSSARSELLLTVGNLVP